MTERPKWIKSTEYEPNTNSDYDVWHGKLNGKTFRIFQMAPDSFKLEINSRQILYNVPRNELLAKYPILIGAMKEIKGGLETSRKKGRFGL